MLNVVHRQHQRRRRIGLPENAEDMRCIACAGTVNASKPASDSSLKFSNGKLASRSCNSARAAKRGASNNARSTGSETPNGVFSLTAMVPSALTMLPLAAQFDTQMMGCGDEIVNEMEFRMSGAGK
jgi:hypothetical protein